MYGRMQYFAKDTFIGRSIHSYGEWSAQECLKIVELAGLADGNVALDIGANIGFMSRALSAHGYNVHAFEPQPVVYDVLVANAVGHNIKPHCCALGASTGVAKMPRISYSEKGNYGGLGLGGVALRGTIDVPVMTLDSLELKDVGFIKIDVEGFEREVLLGACDLIEKYRPVMYIEDDRDDKRALLRQTIVALGYTIEEHDPPMFRPDNYKGRPDNIWGVNYISKNLICKPC